MMGFAEVPVPRIPPVIEANPDGLAVVWEVSADYPGGRSRPMNSGEQAQLKLDQDTAAEEASKPVEPTLEERFHAVMDAFLDAADFDTAKKQIAALKEAA